MKASSDVKVHLERCLLGRLLRVVHLHLERGRGQRSWEEQRRGGRRWEAWQQQFLYQLLFCPVVAESLLIAHRGQVEVANCHARGSRALPKIGRSIPGAGGEECPLLVGGDCWRIDPAWSWRSNPPPKPAHHHHLHLPGLSHQSRGKLEMLSKLPFGWL